MPESIAVANTETPLFEIDFPREGKRFTPRSLEELEQWLQVERQAWSWLNEARTDDAPIEPLVNLMFHQDRGITKTLNAAKSAEAGEQRRPYIETLRTLLTERYVSQQAPTSEAPISKRVAELVREDKVVAAHALWALLGKDPLPSNRPGRAFRGQTIAVLFRYDPSAQVQAHQSAWTEIRGRMSAEHEALRTEAGKLSDDFRKLSNDVRQLHEHQRSTFDELQAGRTTEFKKVLDGHTNTMTNIETSFKRELSLRSAVEYLRDKANQHDKTARSAGIAAGISGLVFVALAAYVGLNVFKGDSETPVPQLAVAVLAATLMFWLLRILVRVLLSNLHLATDMRARSTFVHTYLALLAEGGGIKDEDRALVIGLVFRPISDGLVRDDATPPGLWDLVTKNLSGRS